MRLNRPALEVNISAGEAAVHADFTNNLVETNKELEQTKPQITDKRRLEQVIDELTARNGMQDEEQESKGRFAGFVLQSADTHVGTGCTRMASYKVQMRMDKSADNAYPAAPVDLSCSHL